jgi:hypothetical protein
MVAQPAVLAAGQVNTVQMEILFMNHGPLQPTIRELSAIIEKYSDHVRADWYDYEQPAARQFMKMKNIQGHIPLLIYINGSPTHNLSDREVTFIGFPTGTGPYQFQGKWSVKDLETVIQSMLSTDD